MNTTVSKLTQALLLASGMALTASPVVALLYPWPANAQTPQVPSINSTLANSQAGNATVVASLTPPPAGSYSAPIATAPAALPAPLPAPDVMTGPALAPITPSYKPEPLSPRVKKARSAFDAAQRAQVAEYIAEARQAPTSESTFNRGSVAVFPYRDGAIYTVYVGANRVTDIALQPGEVVTGKIQGGDTARWMVEQVTSGSEGGEQVHVMVKAVEPGISTNIFIPTNRRTYMIDVRSMKDWYMPSVSWTYPMDSWKAQQVSQAREANAEPLSAAPDRLRFAYTVKAPRRARSFAPVSVFDDGAQTYIRMPGNLNGTDAPALFVIEDGKPLLVNYRVKGVADGNTGPVYIVDRLFDRAELRVGAKNAVTIIRQ